MLSREKMLEVIDRGYAARAAGDKADLAGVWAPGATYRLSGDLALIRPFPVGPADAASTVEALIDLFQFAAHERMDAVVEGHSVAVLWRVSISTGGSEPVDTEIYDLFKFNEDGKITSLVQFGDTALIAQMLKST